MKLYTKSQFQILIKNGQPENRDKDHFPVIKLFFPASACTWLISELDPENPNLAFGLCDLGMGFPELGYVDLEEILSVKDNLGLGVERDLFFEAKYPLSVYARASSQHGYIVESETILEQFV